MNDFDEASNILTNDNDEDMGETVDSEEEINQKSPPNSRSNSKVKIKSESDTDGCDMNSISGDLSDQFHMFLNKTCNLENPDEDEELVRLPTGIKYLDAILGGGISVGVVQIVGPSGSGKSALVGNIIANGQKLYGNKFVAIYVDKEESTTKDRLHMLGVRNPPIEPLSPKGSEDICVEDVFKYIEGMCAFKEQKAQDDPTIMDIPWVVAWDSIANTITKTAYETEDVNKLTGEKARVLSLLIPKYVGKLRRNRIILLGINQLRDKIEMGGPRGGYVPPDLKYLAKHNIPGGNSLRFNSIQLLYIRPSTDIDPTKTTQNFNYMGFEGYLVKGRAIKNKLFAPNIEVSLVFNYRTGFNDLWTNWELLKSFKAVNSGAWCSFEEYEEVGKFRQNQLKDLYNSDDKFREIFDKKVDEVLSREVIEKYKYEATD